MFNLFMKSNKKRAKKRAFTLVELVIVIVILGILAGVAAISFSNVTKDAKESVAKANLRAVKSAMQMFAVENSGAYPAKLDDKKLLEKYDPQLKKEIQDSLASGSKTDFKYEMSKTGTAPNEKIAIKVSWREGSALVLEIKIKE